MEKQEYRGNIKQYIVFSFFTLISGIVFYYGIYLYGNDKEMNEIYRSIWAISIILHPICWFVLIKGNWWFKKQNTNSSNENINNKSQQICNKD